MERKFKPDQKATYYPGHRFADAKIEAVYEIDCRVQLPHDNMNLLKVCLYPETIDGQSDLLEKLLNAKFDLEKDIEKTRGKISALINEEQKLNKVEG